MGDKLVKVKRRGDVEDGFITEVLAGMRRKASVITAPLRRDHDAVLPQPCNLMNTNIKVVGSNLLDFSKPRKGGKKIGEASNGSFCVVPIAMSLNVAIDERLLKTLKGPPVVNLDSPLLGKRRSWVPPLLYGDEEGLRGGARISGDDRVMVWISWLRSEAKEENQRNMAVLGKLPQGWCMLRMRDGKRRTPPSSFIID
ncbi:hypothetical protein AtNW77_Chr2g0226391 [Arabidopsis thaliana]|uniref:Uncharacterized protein n=3 Tax=Arabidopsis TaxID=3701 RepID=F4IHC8_ARATH|nr:uncharacterized protein AT2G05752 [Arabidopsis thaliana]AEC05966.1 hypothetical protein AT2G05752 [Arabidopsis thaliana]KAG7635950.1 hypothetical protein ISN45_At02g004470 [Arabidopsis thaliana x Arabidopsis arenosa]VYS52120.1 unnamed protein product [Arabidopsis thaliana]|eukprot:NP_671782.1 hypothetical protein AT2G05752 [Arabidopsis thaliana]